MSSAVVNSTCSEPAYTPAVPAVANTCQHLISTTAACASQGWETGTAYLLLAKQRGGRQIQHHYQEQKHRLPATPSSKQQSSLHLHRRGFKAQPGTWLQCVFHGASATSSASSANYTGREHAARLRRCQVYGQSRRQQWLRQDQRSAKRMRSTTTYMSAAVFALAAAAIPLQE